MTDQDAWDKFAAIALSRAPNVLWDQGDFSRLSSFAANVADQMMILRTSRFPTGNSPWTHARVPLSDLNFSVRTSNILDDMDIIYVDQLCGMTAQDVLMQRNVGKNTLAEIQCKLASVGLSLKT